MKRITISLMLLFFAVGVMAQMSTVNYTGSKPIPANKSISLFTPKNGNSNSGSRSSTDVGSAWLSYAEEINEVLGWPGFNFIAPMFPDSSVYFSYGATPDSNWGKTTAYSIGQTFNAYSTFFLNSGGVDTLSLNTSEGYTIDSIAPNCAYYRLDPDPSIVDTLVVNLFQGVNNSNVFPDKYLTGSFVSQTIYDYYGYDTVFFPEMFYNYQTLGPLESYYTKNNVPVTTVKILLQVADTSAAQIGHPTKIPGGFQVAAGSLVGCTVFFKPGYKYNPGDTISRHYNSAYFYFFDENNYDSVPLYTPGDNNVSYIVTQAVQYNQSSSNFGGWDSSYIPSYAFNPGYVLNDNYIFYHITYNVIASISISPQSPSLCSGESVTLSVPTSGSNYTWSPSTGLSATTGDTVIASPNVITTYYVTGLNSNSQYVSGSDVVFVLPSPGQPVITVSNDTLNASIISGSSWSFDIYQWYDNDTLVNGATDSIYVANTGGWYSVSVINPANGCSTNSDTLLIGGKHVWPGDANEDLEVNNYDLLPIGLYYGDTGIARDTTTIVWAPHMATDWDSLQSNGANRKFADCNGDGTINAEDTLAIVQNYGLTHPLDSPRSSSERTTGTVPLSIVADSSSYHAGSMLHASILLGSSSNPATNLYGLAYNITFDASNVVPGTLVFNYNNASFMGAKNSNALVFTQLNNDVETAVTGIDHTNKTGYGKIGDLYFTLANNSSGQLGLSISFYEAVDAEGNEKGLLPVSDTVSVATGISQLLGINNQVSVYPNPVSNNMFVKINSSVSSLQDWSMQISDELGRVVYKTNSLNHLNEIDMSKLPCAMYFISVNGQAGSSVFPVIRQE